MSTEAQKEEIGTTGQMLVQISSFISKEINEKLNQIGISNHTITVVISDIGYWYKSDNDALLFPAGEITITHSGFVANCKIDIKNLHADKFGIDLDVYPPSSEKYCLHFQNDYDISASLTFCPTEKLHSEYKFTASSIADPIEKIINTVVSELQYLVNIATLQETVKKIIFETANSI